MLIPSERHRRADLELWAEYEAADRIHGEWLSRSGKIERSIESIRKFATDGPCYSGISWGKDSTVLFDLLSCAGFLFPRIWLTYGKATNPECHLVRDCMLATHRGFDYREIDVGESEEMRDDFSPAVRSAKTNRYLSGIRAEESGIRRMSVRRLGIDTGNVCRPMAWWTVVDVFAYLAMRNLPVHPNYAMLGNGRWPREYIRTASIGGDRGTEHGRREWEREYYPDILNRLAASNRIKK